MLNKKTPLLFLGLIFLLTFVSASIILKEDAIFEKYRILGISGNESILFTPTLIGNGNVFKATEKFSGNLTREECILFNQTDIMGGCLQYKNVTYFQPNSLRYRDNTGLDKFISKTSNFFQYTIPLQPLLKWIKFGEKTITIVGDTSYNSTNINVTSETGFAHLNVSNSSIVAYFPFDENYNSTFTYDYTNNSNDGTLVGGTIINTTGCVYGNCYTFDGSNDYITVPDSANLKITNALSISLWVKTGGTNDYSGMVDKFLVLSGYQLSFDTLGGIRFDLGKGSTYSSVATSGVNVENNNWHNVVATYNGTDGIIYIDTIQRGSAVVGGPLATTTQAVTIGTDEEGANRRMTGNLDEVMIWNIVLNSTEVTALYNNQTSRFHGTGEMEFRNLNFGINDTTNISLKNCQTNMGSSLRAKVNNGAYVNFDSSCFIQDYNITGNLTNANLTIGFIGGNGTPANTFYSPLVLGNITLNSTSSDILPPNISFATPTMNATNFSRSNIYANLSFADININFGAIFLYNITSDRINYIKGSTSPLEVNFTALADGTYYLNATANDTKGNINYTETRTIILDNVAPDLIFVNPTTNSSNRSYNNIEVNISFSDATSSISRAVISLYNSSSDLINSSNSQTSTLFINFTGLSDGVYRINATVNDTLNQKNYTETRTIQIDKTFPTMNITYPFNNSILTGINHTLNFTFTETNFPTCFYSILNRTNGVDVGNTTITSCLNTTFQVSQTVTNYTLYLYINDSSNNLNLTTVYFRIPQPIGNGQIGGGTQGGGSGGGGGGSDSVNQTLMCSYSENFLKEHLTKSGYNYTYEDVVNLTILYNFNENALINPSTFENYLDTFEAKCGKTLPTYFQPSVKMNVTLLKPFKTINNETECDYLINRKTEFVIPFKWDYKWDSYVPFLHIKLNLNCDNLGFWRWIFRFEEILKPEYRIIGLQFWWILSGLIGYGSYRLYKRFFNKKPKYHVKK